jgi:hypothetical protein
MIFKSSRIFFFIALAGALALSGCDWANVGGPW